MRIFLFFIFKRWEKETDMMFIHGLWIFFVPLYFRSASTVSALRRRPPLWPRYDYTHLSLHSSCKIGEMSSKSVVPNSPSHRKRRRVYGGRRKNPTGRQWPSHNKLNFHHLLLLVLRGAGAGCCTRDILSLFYIYVSHVCECVCLGFSRRGK